MFTGLIEDVGTVREITSGNGLRLAIATHIPMTEIVLGESIAVNGVCLTVTSFGGGIFRADVSPETVRRTTIDELTVGACVNLERALRLSDRLGGHIVTGHIDAVATLLEKKAERNAILFTIELPPHLRRYVVKKGSIAVDGISLTVNEVTDETLSLSIIPHTLEKTTLREKTAGNRVNIETDIVGKYVERLLGVKREEGDLEKSPIDLDFLAKHGFL